MRRFRGRAPKSALYPCSMKRFRAAAVSASERSLSARRSLIGLDLEVDDLEDIVTAQEMKHDHLVDPVQELGPEERRAAPPSSAAKSPPRSATSRSLRNWLPRFEVMMTIVFLKSTVRPCESVRRPSSRS